MIIDKLSNLDISGMINFLLLEYKLSLRSIMLIVVAAVDIRGRCLIRLKGLGYRQPSAISSQSTNREHKQSVYRHEINMRQKSSKKEKKYFVYIFLGALSVSLVSILNFMLIRRLKKKLFSPYIRPKRDTGHGRKIAFEYDQ